MRGRRIGETKPKRALSNALDDSAGRFGLRRDDYWFDGLQFTQSKRVFGPSKWHGASRNSSRTNWHCQLSER